MTPEDRLQIAVAAFLDVALPMRAAWFAIPNGGSRHKAEAAKLKRMGVKAGIPDLCIIWKGRALFIELKAGRGKQSAAQLGMEVALTISGAVCTVCRSVDDVADFLSVIMPLRARVGA